VLLDESNILESGIEIIAQPRGKKFQSITLLSGGERALTAIALLFAAFLVKPSPFCMLDEVDAPLDEANVTRFTRLIREMSSRSQFITITHNKRTMEMADALYGITMEEPGCSRVVSVQLREPVMA
jgi:chromosome segregation protein